MKHSKRDVQDDDTPTDLRLHHGCLKANNSSNRVAYKKCFIFDHLDTEVIYLRRPCLKCVKQIISKVTGIWLVGVSITNQINGIYPVRFRKNWNIFPPMVTVRSKTMDQNQSRSAVSATLIPNRIAPPIPYPALDFELRWAWGPVALDSVLGRVPFEDGIRHGRARRRGGMASVSDGDRLPGADGLAGG